MKWLEALINKLSELLDKPPYLQFFYIGSIFVVIALITNNHFNLVWLFLLLASVGLILRYIERDYLGHFGVKDSNQQDKYNKKIRFIIITIYHVVNLIWAAIFLHLLWVNI